MISLMICNNQNSAEAFAALVGKSNAFSSPPPAYSFWVVADTEGIGADGWAAIRRMAERFSIAGLVAVKSDRKAMAVGGREDIEAIWQVSYTWWVGSLLLFKTTEGTPVYNCGGRLRTLSGMYQIVEMSEQEEMRLHFNM